MKPFSFFALRFVASAVAILGWSAVAWSQDAPGKSPTLIPEVQEPLVRGALVIQRPAENSRRVPDNFHLVYEQDFEGASVLQDFRFTDAKAWRIHVQSANRSLELARQSEYAPTVRSPVNIALIARKKVGDFILEANLLQTGREYGHRDMCIFFGFQDPSHFYYVHFASAADEHAHNIFIVNGEPRTKIAKSTTKGIDWGHDQWHQIRLERRTVDGSIAVFFDDLDHPIMLASDQTFLDGYVGFGSFDDTGCIDNVRLWAPQVRDQELTVFQKAE